MEMSCQLHDLDAMSPGKQPLVPTAQKGSGSGCYREVPFTIPSYFALLFESDMLFQSSCSK
jgi:hypothetical protein